MKKSKRKRKLLVSAALVASLGMIPQFGTSAQAQSNPEDNNLSPKCLMDNTNNHKKTSGVKMIDKIVGAGEKSGNATGFATAMPEPTRGENSAYSWTTEDTGGLSFTIEDKTYYTDITNPTGSYINNSGTAPIVSGAINSVNADFIGNYASSGYAGALQHDTSNHTMTSVIGDFLGNTTANSSYGGGAIFNWGDKGYSNISSITGNFIGNKATYGSGGAIYNGWNKGGATISIIDSNFIGNYAKQKGGAIYNNNGIVNIIAQNKDILFTNNTSGDGTGIYNNSGTINFNANDGHKITINDNIYLGGTSNVNLNNGTLKLGKNAATNVFTKLTAENSSILDLQNEHAGDFLTVSNLTTDETGLYFNTDYDGLSGIMDKLNITNSTNGGKIVLNSIEILSDSENSGTDVQYLTGNLSNINVETSNSDDNTKVISSTDNYTYTFELADKGHLTVNKTQSGVDLATAISDESVGGSSYTMKRDFTFDENVGKLDGENRDFTIYGQNHSIDGNGKTGIEVSAGQTLTVKDVESYKNFSKGINNKGSLTVKNSTFENNTNSAIYNSGGNIDISGTFKGNRASNGGAIYSTSKGSVTVGGTFEENYSSTSVASAGGAVSMAQGPLTIKEETVFNNNLAKNAGGGAVSVGGSSSSKASLTIEDNVIFKNNKSGYKDFTGETIGKATASGGALYINSNFAQNINFGDNISFTENKAAGSGGAIYNTSGVIDFNGNVEFKNNTARQGGAYYQNGNLDQTIQNATFEGNKASLDENSLGGAIAIAGKVQNYSTPIPDEKLKTLTIKNSNFENNEASYIDSEGLYWGTGGAIGQTMITAVDSKGKYSRGMNVEVKDSSFKENIAGAEGGAINSDSVLNISDSSFVQNKTLGTTVGSSYQDSNEGGGAIFMYDDSITTISDSNFIGNQAGTWGGAIATRGISNGNSGTNSSLTVKGGSFNENEAKYGGAIASSVETTIQNTEFVNNTSTVRGGAVYSNNNNSLSITDSNFIGNDSYLGGAVFLSNGEINVKNSNFTNNTATYGGAMYTTTSPDAHLNIENSTFDGNSAEEVGAIGIISNASIKNSTFKNNVAASTASDSDGAGALFLGAVSDTNITGSETQNTVFENNQSGARGGAISTRTASLANNSAAKLDITNTTFKGNSAQTTGGALDNYFYNSNTSEGSVYVANSTFDSNTANAGGAIYNHGDKDKAGNISSLKIENSNFTGNTAQTNGGAIYNEGTLSISNSTFTDNTANEKANDIHNLNQISFSGTNTLNGGITGTGNIKITDGETFASSIEQQLVEVYENAKLTSQNITTENGITNNGTLVLTGNSNTNAITGNNGTTIIAGTLENSAIINQTVEVEHDAKLVSALENLGLTIKNDGTIVASGTLDKEISGTGTTKIDSNMAMITGGSITGSLDLNGGSLDLTSDASVNEYSVGSLLNTTGTGNLGIDIDFTGPNLTTDTLKIENGTNNSGTITLNDINVIGSLSGFTAEILKGETSGVILAISDELKDSFKMSTDWTDNSSTDVLTKTAEWDDKFGTTTWKERLNYELDVVDNTKIKFDGTTEKQNIETVYGETVALLNQTTQFGTEERKFTTNDATKNHTVTENLGTTAAGTMIVKGAKTTAGEITNISTIDMDGHSGFVVSNAGSTLNIDNVKFKNAINTNGGVVNVSNKNTVNITNSEFADNVGLTASTSSRGGAVYNEGGTVNIDNSTFTGNKARYGGAVYNKRKLVTGKDVSSMNISNSVFGGDNIEDGNTSTSQGGAIYNTSKMTISDSVFKNNSSAENMNGGAISNEANSDLTISGNTLFENNNSGKLGGAIYNTEKLNINGAKFKSNTAQEGGGAVYSTGTTAIDGTTFEENHAVGTVGGGAIADGNTGTININNSTFINNSSEYEGGAVAARRTQSKTTTLKLDITNSTFKGNQAGVNQDGTASANAETHGFGGAIYNVASRGTTDANAVTISNSTFGGTKEGEGNSAVKGGAIYNGVDVVTTASSGVMNIDNTTFINNTAQVSGGAVSNENVMKISNSTFTGNTANGVANDIDNTGELSLSGTNTLEGGITGDTGTTNITSGATYAKSLTQKLVNISEGAKLTVNSNLTTGTGENEGVVNSSENGLELQGGTLTGNVTGEGSTAIKGNLEITDGSSIAQSITLAKNKTLTSNAAALKGDITSSGIINLTGGDLSNTITGGLLNINENTNANAANLKVLSTNIYADKVLTLGDGELTTNVLGSGSMAINGDVINKSEVGVTTEILSGSLDNTNGILSDVIITNGSLTSNADNVLGPVSNYGTYNILGGTISNNISGNGLTNIKGNTLASASISGDIDVAEGVTLKYNPNLYRTRLLTTSPTTQKIILNNDSTLDISGNVSNTTTNLSIANGKTSKLLMDWGDVISTNDIEGHLNVASIDMTNTNNETEAYMFATGENPSNVAISDNVNLITTPTSANMVKYTATGENAGKLVSSVNNLVSAVTTSQTGESAIYSMTTSESTGAGEAKVLDGGRLTIQGNGNDIAGSGIVVGDGASGNAELTVKDANMKNITGDALIVKGGNTVSITAENSDVEISGISGNAITLKSDNNGTSTVNINAGNKTIKIDNDIISDSADNVVKFNSGTVEFNGLFDPAEAVVEGATVVRGGNDDNIQWTVTDGTLKYLNDSYLNYNVANTINMNGGNLDTRNGAVTDFAINNFTLSADSNFYGDVDLANSKMDNFRNTPVVRTDGTLHVAGLNLISDALNENTAILFTPDDWIGQGYIDYTGPAQLTAIAPIYKYNVSYDDVTGNFNFGRVRNGNYTDYNPSLYAPAVAAQLGGYFTQINSYNQAFSNMDSYMLMTSSQREAMKMRNKYAASDGNLIFDPTINQYENAAGWFRPYATFEKVGLNGGPSVDNISYGTFMGGESKLYDLGHGWDGMWGAYLGYNGSHQNYDTVGIYQNGGTLGLVGMAYKGNFFTGLTANVGANGAEASSRFGSDTFGMLMTGIASKTGYNFELGRGENKGKFIIQPSLLASYSFVNTFDYRNSSGVSIHSDPLHAIQIEPGIKFIANLKNGWQPYAGISMVWNILDKSKLSANNVSLPSVSVDPYVRYGIGVRKAWGERFTGFTQAYVTNGGRNGVGLQAGFRWAIGK